MKEIKNYKLDYDEQFWMDKIENCHEEKYFATHRHSFYEILIITSCNRGVYTHSIDFVSFKIEAGKIYFIAPNQIHTWHVDSYNEEYKGYMITFNKDFLQKQNKDFSKCLLKLFNPLDKNRVVKFDVSKINSILPTFNILEYEYFNKSLDLAMIRSLFESLLHFMSRLKYINVIDKDIKTQYLIEVQNLIEIHFKVERKINFYAKELEFSAKRLNEIIKEKSGLTVIQLLHNRLILEAKRELSVGDKTVQKISDELGFENVSYFSIFFKKNVGISPSLFSKVLFK